MTLPEATARMQHGVESATLSAVTRWRSHELSLLWLAALAPTLLLALISHRLPLFNSIAVVLGIFQLWRIIFGLIAETSYRRFISKNLLSAHDVVHAVILVLLLPIHLPLWQIALSASFGYVFAERLFGGRGFGFLNPVVLALSFQLQISGVEILQTAISTVSIYWLMPALVAMLLYELVSYRTLAGIFIAAALSIVLMGTLGDLPSQVATTVLLVVLFLACDPASGASSNPGRWIHGLLYGYLAVLLMHSDPQSLAPFINAALLASLAGPLIDYIVVYVHIYRRRKRHG